MGFEDVNHMLQIVAHNGCAFAQGVAPTTRIVGAHNHVKAPIWDYSAITIHMHPHRGREHITNLLHSLLLS